MLSRTLHPGWAGTLSTGSFAFSVGQGEAGQDSPPSFLPPSLLPSGPSQPPSLHLCCFPLAIASIWPACSSYSFGNVAAAHMTARQPRPHVGRGGALWGLSTGNPAKVAAPGIWHPDFLPGRSTLTAWPSLMPVLGWLKAREAPKDPILLPTW